MYNNLILDVSKKIHLSIVLFKQSLFAFNGTISSYLYVWKLFAQYLGNGQNLIFFRCFSFHTSEIKTINHRTTRELFLFAANFGKHQFVGSLIRWLKLRAGVAGKVQGKNVVSQVFGICISIREENRARNRVKLLFRSVIERRWKMGDRERTRERKKEEKKEKKKGRKSAYEQLFVVPRCERMKIPNDEFSRIRFLFRVTYSQFSWKLKR